MARKIVKNYGAPKGSLTSNRIQTADTIIKAINESKPQDTEFYELETVEVLEVHLDETLPSFPKKGDGTPDYQYLGGIIGRYTDSEYAKNIDKCKNFKPINPNMNFTPMVGEVVIGVEYHGEHYYTTHLNFFGNPNFNTQHGISKGNSINTNLSSVGKDVLNADDTNTRVGYYLTRDTDSRKLLPNEGDIIFEGRFGNSIRIGSDIKNENEDSPNIILNVGQSKDEFPEPKQPVEEKIDTDGSSVYLTTNQTLEFTPGIESKVVKAPYEGKNILLSSDRIIFNTKNGGDIAMFSHNNVSIGAVSEVVIESPVTKIGSSNATEPMVLGDKLEAVLNDILTLIETGLLAPTGPVKVVPGLATLQKLKSNLGVPSIKSPKNTVE